MQPYAGRGALRGGRTRARSSWEGPFETAVRGRGLGGGAHHVDGRGWPGRAAIGLRATCGRLTPSGMAPAASGLGSGSDLEARPAQTRPAQTRPAQTLTGRRPEESDIPGIAAPRRGPSAPQPTRAGLLAWKHAAARTRDAGQSCHALRGAGRRRTMSTDSWRPRQAAVRFVVTGHYGSGKTEVSVSLAMRLAGLGHKVALADLDIVNPYFRSRVQADLMTAWASRGHQAPPSATPSPSTCRRSRRSPRPAGRPDLRGHPRRGRNEVGVKVLAEFAADLRRREAEVLLVVNAYRPETVDVPGVLRHLRAIEATSGFAVTGLISNTHVCRGDHRRRRGRRLSADPRRQCGDRHTHRALSAGCPGTGRSAGPSRRSPSWAS